MIIIATQDFLDKTTAKKKEDQKLIKAGTILINDETLAKQRIKKKLAIEILNPEILIPKLETPKTFTLTEPIINKEEPELIS